MLIFGCPPFREQAVERLWAVSRYEVGGVFRLSPHGGQRLNVAQAGVDSKASWAIVGEGYWPQARSPDIQLPAAAGGGTVTTQVGSFLAALLACLDLTWLGVLSIIHASVFCIPDHVWLVPVPAWIPDAERSRPCVSIPDRTRQPMITLYSGISSSFTWPEYRLAALAAP